MTIYKTNNDYVIAMDMPLVIGGALLFLLLLLVLLFILRSIKTRNITSDDKQRPFPSTANQGGAFPAGDNADVAAIRARISAFEAQDGYAGYDASDLDLSAGARAITRSHFMARDLHKRFAVIDATIDDISRQIAKLSDAVPEDVVPSDAQKAGYVDYGSYAAKVKARIGNLRISRDDLLATRRAIMDDITVSFDAIETLEREHFMSKDAKKP